MLTQCRSVYVNTTHSQPALREQPASVLLVQSVVYADAHTHRGVPLQLYETARGWLKLTEQTTCQVPLRIHILLECTVHVCVYATCRWSSLPLNTSANRASQRLHRHDTLTIRSQSALREHLAKYVHICIIYRLAHCAVCT